MSKTLTPAQENLLRALQSGVQLRYHAEWWITRCDTGQDSTTQVQALLKSGLLQRECGNVKTTEVFRLTKAGRSWPDPHEKEGA